MSDILFDSVKFFTIPLFFIFIYRRMRFNNNESKKNFLENAKFVLAKNKKNKYRPVIPTYVFELPSRILVRTIRPKLDRHNDYSLNLVERSYDFHEIELPKEDFPNFKSWEKIGEMFREICKIDGKISKHENIIQQILSKKTFAEVSNIYLEYLQKYDQLISQLEDEIQAGKRFRDSLNTLIREYLIGMELSELDTIQLINEVQSSKYKSKELSSNIEAESSSLLADVEVYLETIDEYSETLKSLDNL